VVVAAVVVGILYAVGSANQGGSTPPATHTSTTDTTATHRHHHVLPATPHPRKVTLRMVPTGSVYVCLVNGAGRKLIFEQVYATGQTIPVEKGKKLLLTLGNNSIDVKANGRPVPIAPSATPIRLLITAKHTSHIPLTQQPTCP
jgi:hypothetical protein